MTTPASEAAEDTRPEIPPSLARRSVGMIVKLGIDSGLTWLAGVAPWASASIKILLTSKLARRVILWGGVAGTLMLASCGVIALTIGATVAGAPVQIAASVLGWVPGVPEGQHLDPPSEILCANQADPDPKKLVPTTTTAAPPPRPPETEGSENSDSVEGSGEPTASPPEPPPLEKIAPLSDNGRITQVMLDYIQDIPAGVSAREAGAWLLYAPTHPGTSWEEFDRKYRPYASKLSETASGVDVAVSMDSTADYRPYALPAAAAALAGIIDHRFAADAKLQTTLSEIVLAACNPAGRRAVPQTGTRTAEVPPARNPGWTRHTQPPAFAIPTDQPAPSLPVDAPAAPADSSGG